MSRGCARRGSSWLADYEDCRASRLLLEGLVTHRLEPLAASQTAAGADPVTALNRARARIVRGLLLDPLATGDRAGVDSTMEEFLRLFYGPD